MLRMRTFVLPCQYSLPTLKAVLVQGKQYFHTSVLFDLVRQMTFSCPAALAG